MASAKGNESTDEITVVMRRFGDDQSTLLDRFERLSFEAHLNRAILTRSLSTPGGAKFRLAAVEEQQLRQDRRGPGFYRALKRFFRPIFGRNRKNGEVGKQSFDPRIPQYSKALGRSLKF